MLRVLTGVSGRRNLRGMNKHHVAEIVGSQSEIARILGLTRAAVSLWPDTVPDRYQRYLLVMVPNLKRNLGRIAKKLAQAEEAV